MSYNPQMKNAISARDLNVHTVSYNSGEAIIQLQQLFPKHAHRIRLHRMDLNHWLWDEVYRKASWVDGTVFYSIFIDKMVRRLNKYPIKNLYMIAPTVTITPVKSDSLFSRTRGIVTGMSRLHHKWCLYFMTPHQFQMKVDELLVRNIHEE